MGSRKRRSAIDAVACLIQEVHQAWGQKQLAGALFMDVKGAFDHVDPAKLVKRMRELGIDGDLICWVRSFLADRRVQLMIDGTQCPEHPISSGVPQGSPVSPILFVIYLSGIFEAVEAAVPGIRALSFADDIGLIASGTSVEQICKQLQQAGETAIAWGQANAVQFDEKKTEAVLFTRKRGQELRNQVQRATVQVGQHQAPFKQEATRWLGIWLDTGLTLKKHYLTCLQKARSAEGRLKTLCHRQGLPPGLVRRIQVAAVQAVALYGAELWWQGQKDRLAGVQQMINRQARAITGMFRTTPIGPMVREAGLEPAETLLEARQLGYTIRLLGLPNSQPARQILPVTFREGDCHAQPGEQPIGDRVWAEASGRGPWSLGQHLARQLAGTLKIDPSGGFEETIETFPSTFPGIIKVLPVEEAYQAARAARPGLTLWSDGSRLEDGRTGAGIAWQNSQGTWQTREIPLGAGKEIFDAELAGVCQALHLAQKIKGQGPVTVILDSRAAIDRLQHRGTGPGQALAIQAHEAVQSLQARGRQTTIQWVPGHEGIEGNEQADQAAKRAAARSLQGGSRELSLAYTRRNRTEAMKTRRQNWLARALARRPREAQRAYRAHQGWKQDPVAAAAPKKIASRYYQLKTGHAAIGTYLKRMQAQESEACRDCQAPKESIHHLLFECRQWRRQRETLYQAMNRAGVATPTATEDHPESRLLGEPKATRALLQFLADTKVGCPPGDHAQAAERARKDNEWGLEALEEAERIGDG
ncbi:hypothetical protein VTN00DRAFT_5109 [Thermoascus crustaceus]|uniref:uncharacterized protein n=1 Tax=Thermoascus crustaceus TaxID=5088 RepID=UPI0037427440